MALKKKPRVRNRRIKERELPSIAPRARRATCWLLFYWPGPNPEEQFSQAALEHIQRYMLKKGCDPHLRPQTLLTRNGPSRTIYVRVADSPSMRNTVAHQVRRYGAGMCIEIVAKDPFAAFSPPLLPIGQSEERHVQNGTSQYS